MNPEFYPSKHMALMDELARFEADASVRRAADFIDAVTGAATNSRQHHIHDLRLGSQVLPHHDESKEIRALAREIEIRAAEGLYDELEADTPKVDYRHANGDEAVFWSFTRHGVRWHVSEVWPRSAEQSSRNVFVCISNRQFPDRERIGQIAPLPIAEAPADRRGRVLKAFEALSARIMAGMFVFPHRVPPHWKNRSR